MSKKVALITGTSRGIGHHLARHFYAQGYHLILIARDALGINVTTRCPDVVDFVMSLSPAAVVEQLISGRQYRPRKPA